MGHLVRPDREHHRLQRRLDRTITGAPDSPVLMKILRLLFSPEEAALAREMPDQLASLDALSARLGIPRDELGAKLDEMAGRGLVFDVQHDGRRYFTLAPLAFGFFEFTFMRVRDDLPMAELSRLFDEYFHADDRFFRSVFRERTQQSRALVREEALPEDDHTEVLDWERASRVVRSASAIAVSLCSCRHKAAHLGKACRRPQRCCLSLNYAADFVVRNRLGEPVTTHQAMRILEDCKRAGLAQFGDNVQRKLAYICNCCGCCCEMVRAIKTCGLGGAIVTSNWIVAVDAESCQGCGKCVEACPVGAIRLVEQPHGRKPRQRAVCDEGLCLGCGVCYPSCPSGAIAMKPRQKRVFTPETVFDRVVAMAIERGKLSDLIFDSPGRLSHRALGRIVGAIEKSPFFKAAMAIKPLRSVFLGGLVAAGKKRTARLREIFE